MKPILKLGFADTFDNCVLFFEDILSRRYNVVRDDVTPEYLIFGDSNFGQTHFKYDINKTTKIFYTGENVRPDYNTYTHAITFDFENSPRHYRLPLYVMEMWAAVTETKCTDDYYYLRGLHSRIDWEKEFDLKTENISYIQSNPRCQERNAFVAKLQTSLKVNCGGPHMNNIGYVIPRNRPAKLDFLRKHKTNIAFENGSYPGYVTEKLIDAFYSNTLPIYWGSDMVDRDFNKGCFLWLKYPDTRFTEYLDDIKSVLKQKELWCEIMSQPRFKKDIPNGYTNLDNFLDWFGKCVYHG